MAYPPWVCLGFPEATESNSWGHPNFRAGKKTFAALEKVDGRPSIAFRLSASDIPVAARKRFFSTPYGRGLWISVWADDALDWQMVGEMLELSYRAVANQRMLTALAGAGAPTKSRRGSKSVARQVGRGERAKTT